jgi:hypothetical protein
VKKTYERPELIKREKLALISAGSGISGLATVIK